MAWAQVALGIFSRWASKPETFTNRQRLQIEMWLLERAA